MAKTASLRMWERISLGQEWREVREVEVEVELGGGEEGSGKGSSLIDLRRLLRTGFEVEGAELTCLSGEGTAARGFLLRVTAMMIRAGIE